MKSRIILILIVLGFVDVTIYSQNQFDFLFNKDKHYNDCRNIKGLDFKLSLANDSTQPCEIILTDGTQLKDVKFLNSDDSAFTITRNGIDKNFSISRIHKITFEKHNFGTGVLIGAAASLAFWGILGIGSGNSDGIKWGLMIGAVFAIPTGIIGGLIAEFLSGNDVYHFNNINPSSRSNRLKNIILRHKQ